MTFLNASIPPIECLVRAEYLRNLEDSHGEYFPCLVFGVASIPHRVPLFHFHMEDEGLWWRAPISAFCTKPCPSAPLSELVLWDSFSYHISVHAFDYMRLKRITYRTPSGVTLSGIYLFTLDWAAGDPNLLDTGFSESPDQHKSGHVIQLHNGNFAIQPNNRVRMGDPSFATKIGQNLVKRKSNSTVFTVENGTWSTEDSSAYHYGVDNLGSKLDSPSSKGGHK